MNSADKALVLGTYVKGVFDTSSSRGIFTAAAALTMVRGLVALYGENQFTVEPAATGTQAAAPDGDIQTTLQDTINAARGITAHPAPPPAAPPARASARQS